MKTKFELIKKWWKKLGMWKKGLFIGSVYGLVGSLVATKNLLTILIFYPPASLNFYFAGLSRWLMPVTILSSQIQMAVYSLAFFGLFGAFLGHLKNSSRNCQLGAILGGAWGLLSMFIYANTGPLIVNGTIGFPAYLSINLRYVGIVIPIVVGSLIGTLIVYLVENRNLLVKSLEEGLKR